MIGGTDVICSVRSDAPVADIIFRTVRRYWPEYVFQEVDAPIATFVRPQGCRVPRPKGREFFVYRNEQAALSWDEHGAIPENANTMLYVLLPREQGPEPRITSMTLVCGELVGEMDSLVRAIRASFEESIESLATRAEAA